MQYFYLNNENYAQILCRWRQKLNKISQQIEKVSTPEFEAVTFVIGVNAVLPSELPRWIHPDKIYWLCCITRSATSCTIFPKSVKSIQTMYEPRILAILANAVSLSYANDNSLAQFIYLLVLSDLQLGEHTFSQQCEKLVDQYSNLGPWVYAPVPTSWLPRWYPAWHNLFTCSYHQICYPVKKNSQQSEI